MSASAPNPQYMMYMMMQQAALERQAAMEAEHRKQLLQRDMDMQLHRMRAEQELADERARTRALQDANMKALWEQFMFQK
jgi:hypothetical protein